MIVSIHQPHFLPWLGYFNKALHSDTFVWLNSVQYRKNYFQNRTRIKGSHAGTLWLTIPVHAPLGTPINQVLVADPRWRAKIERTIEQCYRKAPYFTACWPELGAAISSASDSLDALNLVTFRAVLRLLGCRAPCVVPDEHLGVEAEDPTVRLVEMCVKLGASHYIAGRGGKNYLRVEEFHREGIEVIWQQFDQARVVYPQQSDSFESGLSVLDCLFNVGPEQTKDLILSAWKP